MSTMSPFKRKRSDSNSSPASTSSLFSRSSVSPSPPTHHPSTPMQLDVPTQAHASPAHSWVWQPPRSEANNHSGRTMKRFRDNRPDERLVHESTLRRLYSAQREHPHASPIPSHDPAAEAEAEADIAAPVSHQAPVQKTTLHNFWKISPAPTRPPAASLPAVSAGAGSTRCEGCNASLVSEDSMDMDVDMDVDGYAPQQQFTCNHCGRMVCGTCSVSCDVRSCLNCAMT